jgi:hypothetical protein
MKFFRSILGTDREPDSAQDADGRASDEPEDPADEAKHDLALQKEFSRALSPLVQRQLQFEKYRWEPPVQTNPLGTWFVTEEVETDELVLRPGASLEFVERAGDGATAPWRMRTSEGRIVELPIQSDPDAVPVPAGLSRTSPDSREPG